MRSGRSKRSAGTRGRTKLDSTGLKDGMTRREFLRGMRFGKGKRVLFHGDRCTGCGLCLRECSTGALSLSRGNRGDGYQILLKVDLCDGCGHCEKICPEHCFRLEQKTESEKRTQQAEIIFEDKFSRCIGCGVPLFPQALLKKLEAKLFGTGKPAWSMNVCPSCRAKSQLPG